MSELLHKNFDLALYNTFGVSVKADYFAPIASLEALEEVLVWYREQKDMPLLILGGGSNILFTKDFPGLVLQMKTTGKKQVYEDESTVHVEIAGGENWHDFVMWTVENQLYGLENLALIPGNVGASPIQNIGAYGVEIKDYFVSLEALNIETGEREIFSHQECQFGYRNSVFKDKEKSKWIILSVTFALHRKLKLNLEYGALKRALEAKGIFSPTQAQVAETVIEVRQSKLPDTKILGSGGSFFKNPIVSRADLEALEDKHEAVPFFEISSSEVKIPAAWLIDQCEWKGKRFGQFGVHEHQPLVLVNYGGANGKDIANLSREIQESVEQKFGVRLEAEVNIL